MATDLRRTAVVCAALGMAGLVAGYAYGLHRKRLAQRMRPVVVELWVFPVKGCRGIAVDSVEVAPNGFKYDREWVILKEDAEHTVVTQRNCPKIATIGTRIDELAGTLQLLHDGKPAISVPLRRVGESDEASFELWALRGAARAERDDVGRWLSDICGFSVGLYRVTRNRDPLSTPKNRAMPIPPGSAVRAHDFSSVSIISRKTVGQARDACGDPTVDVPRFRMNIVVDTPDARDEDTYRRMECNGISFIFVKFTSRCNVPTVRGDGTFHPRFEPTRTLRERFSARPAHDPSGAAKPIAGINVFHHGTGLIRVGDRLEVRDVGDRPRLTAESV